MNDKWKDISSEFLHEATSGLDRPQVRVSLSSPKYIITMFLLDDYQVQGNLFKQFVYIFT